jgi:hypothetical protein
VTGRAAVLAVLVFLASAAFAGEPIVDSAGALPEGAASQSLRSALAGEGIRVRVGESVLAELWVVTEIAAAPEPKSKPGANFTAIADGALLGVVRFEAKWSDYRGRSVAAGTYSLRYAIQPVDGDHMGVSEFLDYAVLVPAARDLDPKPIADRKALYALGREASGRNHPAILYLVPPGRSAAPSTFVPAPGSLALVAAPGGQAVGFVLRGKTDAEGG